MTAILKFDRPDGLQRSGPTASYSVHMHPSPHSRERKDAKALHGSGERGGSSISTSSDASYQRNASHQHHNQQQQQQQHKQQYDTEQQIKNVGESSGRQSDDTKHIISSVDRRVEPKTEQQQHQHQHQHQQPPAPFSMRDRYNYRADEGGASRQSAFGQASPSQSGSGKDWRFTMSHTSSSNSSAGAKRRHSERSPSRPRSQQGSQAAQIASVKEAERDIAHAGRFIRDDEQQQHQRSTMSDEEYERGRESVRKTPRLDVDPAAAHASSVDWPQRRRLSHVSESEPTSASVSSTHLRVSRSRNPSVGDDGSEVITAAKRSMIASGVSERESRQFDEDESNYTWRQNERDRETIVARPSSPSMRLERSQTSDIGLRLPGPTSAPASAVQQQRQLEHDVRRSERDTSPPPRLPGFASLSPYQSQSGLLSRPNLEGRDSQHSIPSPPRTHMPSLSQQKQHPHSHGHSLMHGGGGSSSSGATSGHQRMNSFGMPAYATTSPPQPAHGPSSISVNSPSLSQASHTPGQAFIHPSLAGLPGSGGGAGSKQQPSFVSKLYSMLEDDTIEEMIAWGPAGTTFSVANPAEFAKIVLPNWFKHSNWQSFVRQLNMYGFHKVNHTYQGTPEEEIQVWEFKHPNFRRGEVHLLGEIKRKSSRHKRQDSLTRSMTHAADYDLMGTPSPEISLSQAGAGMHGHFAHGLAHPPPAAFAGSLHHGQAVPPHMYARSAPTAGPQAAYHREYVEGAGPPRPPPPTALQQPRQAVHHVRHPSGGVVAVAGSAPPPLMSGHGGVEMRHAERPMQVQREAAAMVGSGDIVGVRMDDLSERVDAIIRHAAYLEEQLRSVSEQLFHSQQNEASLRNHVHHLEAQMRSISDQLYQTRQGSISTGGGAGSSTAPNAPYGSATGSAISQHAPPSPSSSLARLRSQRAGSGIGSPPSAAEKARGEGAGRFNDASTHHQTGGPSTAVATSAYHARSPALAHPSYAARSMPLHSSQMTAPGMGAGSASALASGRNTPASSADAYTKLGPPPPSAPGSASARMSKDELL